MVNKWLKFLKKDTSELIMQEQDKLDFKINVLLNGLKIIWVLTLMIG